MEFLKLRRLQKDYHPLSSSNSLLTNSTALHQSWDPTRDGNVASNYVEYAPRKHIEIFLWSFCESPGE
jgi:hypothetical protein